MSELSIVGLRVLCEVSRLGSFTAAAESLGYTQSAVSRQVAALERAAATRLFERSSRGVRLTDAGSALWRHAIAALEELDVAERELAGLQDLASGRLRVGAFPTAVAALLPRALSAFRSAHPGVEVLLREGTTPAQIKRLLSGAADLCVVGGPAGLWPDDERIAYEPLLEDPLLLAVTHSHPFAKRRIVDVQDLTDERWITASTDPRETLLGVWPSLEWQPQIAFIARDWTAKLGLVAAGLGVTVVPGLAAAAVPESVALVQVRSKLPATRSVALATRVDAVSPAQRSFAEMLHGVAGELAVELKLRIRDR
jgi:DNA-binding transcriptional LysR family regulator